MPGYEVWTFHSESSTRVIAEDEHDCDMGDIDRMDEMLEAIEAEVTEDPPIMEVEAFFKLLKASEEPLHEHTEVTLLAFITRMMAIKSKYFFLQQLLQRSRETNQQYPSEAQQSA
jgi:hypothetical protein